MPRIYTKANVQNNNPATPVSAETMAIFDNGIDALDIKTRNIPEDGSFDPNQFVLKEQGKVLSSENFTSEYKSKLDGIQPGAQVNDVTQESLNIQLDTKANKAINDSTAENGQILTANGDGTSSFRTLENPSLFTEYKDRVQLIAHRGFMSQYPENTVYSAIQALRFTDYLECDVQFTSDGVMVLMHDLTVNRTTNGTGTVTALSSSYLTNLDAGNKFNSYFSGIKVPSIDDYIKSTHRAKHMYIELKAYRNVNDITTMAQYFVNNGVEDRVTIQSFQYSTVLPYVRSVSKKIRVGALITDQNAFNTQISIAENDENTIMLIPTTIANIDNLNACIQSKLEVGVWTINTSDEIKNLLNLGYTKLMLNKQLEVPK